MHYSMFSYALQHVFTFVYNMLEWVAFMVYLRRQTKVFGYRSDNEQLCYEQVFNCSIRFKITEFLVHDKMPIISMYSIQGARKHSDSLPTLKGITEKELFCIMSFFNCLFTYFFSLYEEMKKKSDIVVKCFTIYMSMHVFLFLVMFFFYQTRDIFYSYKIQFRSLIREIEKYIYQLILIPFFSFI